MILELDEEDTKVPISDDYDINEAEGSDIKVYEKGILGGTEVPCL